MGRVSDADLRFLADRRAGLSHRMGTCLPEDVAAALPRCIHGVLDVEPYFAALSRDGCTACRLFVLHEAAARQAGFSPEEAASLAAVKVSTTIERTEVE